MHLRSSQDLGNEAQCLRDAVQLMLDTDGDIRGTVASLAREIEDSTIDGMLISRCLACLRNTEPYKSQRGSPLVHMQLGRSQESNNFICSNFTTTAIPTLRFLIDLQIRATSTQTFYLAVQSFTSPLSSMVDVSPPQ
jgi:hypothetical protein